MEQKRLDRIQSVVSARQSGLVVVFEDIHDPHNVAAILRTCDALGIQTAYLIFEKEKPYNPKKIGKGASSSANKWLDFHIFHSTQECLNKLKKDGYTIVATALTDTSETLGAMQFPEKKVALLVGNEHEGLSQTAIKLADRIMLIPMYGFVQSLNVSVATAIALWEITRQRNTSGKNFTLTQDEQNNLLNDWIERAKK